MEHKEIHWAYAAGMIDADGSIGMYKHRPRKSHRWVTPRYYLSACVVNNSYALMEWLEQGFGGRINDRRKVKPQHHQTYRWRLPSSKVREFLFGIAPYVIVKQEQLQLALSYLAENPDCRGLPGKRCPDWVLDMRQSYWEKFHELNHGHLYRPQRLSEAASQVDDAIV